MVQRDVLDFLPPDHSGRKEIIALIKKTSDGILKHQDPASGLWWPVLDQGGRDRTSANVGPADGRATWNTEPLRTGSGWKKET